jgi:amino-acid N-acetyltransferase
MPVFFCILEVEQKVVMRIQPVDQSMRKEIEDLLQSQKLPAKDLPIELDDFYVAINEQKIVGLIGMERYGQYGLLRSMVVHPGFRNRQIAATLVSLLEDQAASSGISVIYLLTETASDYFGKKGFSTVDRKDVPDALKLSSEFSHVCPVSAYVMKKKIS